MLPRLILSLIATMCFCASGTCQSDGRLAGQAPQKWITLKHSVSPRRVLTYQGENYNAEFEDISAKIWIPFVLKENFKLAAGTSYRTEQIEFETPTNEELNSISHWNLRSAGVDIKSVAKLSEKETLMMGVNLSYSATVQSVPLGSSPLNYSFSAVYLNRRSANKEQGIGILYSGNAGSFPVLPVVIWNETFNEKTGIEISLPYKMAWRWNLTKSSIIHLKAEAIRRNYFVNQESHKQCRRLDVDLGASYTQLFNKWVGIEIFSGYRQNISSELPNNIELTTGSGFATSIELFVVPAFSRKAK